LTKTQVGRHRLGLTETRIRETCRQLPGIERQIRFAKDSRIHTCAIPRTLSARLPPSSKGFPWWRRNSMKRSVVHREYTSRHRRCGVFVKSWCSQPADFGTLPGACTWAAVHLQTGVIAVEHRQPNPCMGSAQLLGASLTLAHGSLGLRYVH